jgi:SAM-dependent MidA family methyltransferase
MIAERPRSTPSDGSNPALVAAIRAEIAAAGGQITFARFMELALYHPEHGYYLGPERRPGRGGDFLTAPEASPLFGLTLARQVVECWERLGRPDPFVVREYGAGVGGLAYDLIAGLTSESPAARAAIEYRLIEPNRHRLRQALDAMAEVGLDRVVRAEEPVPAGADLPPITGVVLANEVADAFPVHRLVVRGGRFRERYVVEGAHDEGAQGARGARGAQERDVGGEGALFGEVEGEPSAAEVGAELWERLVAAGVVLNQGDLVDASPAAARWFGSAARGVARGYAIVIDYGYSAAELYQAHRLRGTVRAYAGHTVSDDPYRRVGRQDLTAHVDFTALQRAGEAAGLTFAGLTTQGAFLASLGLGDVLLDLQRDPAATPADYYAAQAAVHRLIDPGGLGRFRVLLMARDAPVTPPLRGLSVAPPPF